MKTNNACLALTETPQSALAWDYSSLARSYDARPDYAADLVADVLRGIDVNSTSRVIDVGAGTGALTAHLCAVSLDVLACEPNEEMRKRGRVRAGCQTARWINARGEALPVADSGVDLVCYGSSFNVIPAPIALAEARRVLGADGHWVALWNHRDLDDPLQQAVERCIRHRVPHYSPGRRRDDPRADVDACGGFLPAQTAQARVVHTVDSAEWLRAWRSHATLKQQAGDAFERVLQDIAELLVGTATLQVPYLTRMYWARRAPCSVAAAAR